MKIGKYKINSSVVMACFFAIIAAVIDILTNGAVVGIFVQILVSFVDDPEPFRPYLTERAYQFFLLFAPSIILLLRVTNIRYKPPIEKIEKPKEK